MRIVNRNTGLDSFHSEIRNEYFEWLCDIITVNQRHDSYFILAKILHEKKFYWSVPNDDDRAMDGEKLREEFVSETRCAVYEALNRPCTVLEMLIGVSRRIEDIMYNCERGDRTDRWFWEIMGNIGLDKYTDSRYAEVYGRERIDILIENWLDRKYKRNGEGGLFPLKRTKKDQRKVELWYQMSAYLIENYYMDGMIL